MPNKEGGFAPNYTPTALTDGASGIILDSNVLDEINESGEALPAVDRQTELCGEAPENFLSDGGNASRAILAGLEERAGPASVPACGTGEGRDGMALGVPDIEPEENSVSAVTTASSGAGSAVRSRPGGLRGSAQRRQSRSLTPQAHRHLKS